ncbi:MAG: S9 family peptidase [Thermoanaerobaculia bacterium]
MLRRGTLVLLGLLAAFPLFAGEKLLTINDVYDPAQRIRTGGAAQAGFSWIDDKTLLWPKTDARGDVTEYLVVDVPTGRRISLFDPDELAASIRKVAGVSEEAAKKLVHQRSYTFDPSYKHVLLEINDDLYLVTLLDSTVTRLTSNPAKEMNVTFSPDGSKIAFVRSNDLFTLDVKTSKERQLTTSGGPLLLNGTLDWVYSEEIYGRGHFKAYWWSPDSNRIAFLQLDESPVPEFAVVDNIPTDQDVDLQKYPQAGDPNPLPRLFVVDANGGTPHAIDTGKYTPADLLIVNVDWKPDSSAIVYQAQNRIQTWLDLNLIETGADRSKTLFRETTPAWVEPGGPPHWLADGSFLWLTETSGYKHIEHRDATGKLLQQVTSGPWEVRDYFGVDQKNGVIYFAGTERSVIGNDVYSVGVDGTNLTRLTDNPGSHDATFSPSMTYFVDRWSDASTPPQVDVFRSDGSHVRVLDDNPVPELAGYVLSKPEFLQVKTRDGFVMEAMLIKPAGFDPSRKYPVYEYTYSGPHAQQVVNRFGREYLWWQLLAERGIAVWVLDNRTASGKGAVSTWPLYKYFGKLELQDLEDGIAYLKQQPWVDSSRMLLYGWSYGGFMTTYAMTHSKSWSAGIAGGSVTDWHDYDSIYTERYMGLPQDNPDAYHDNAPRWAATNLSGKLLLIHGAIDDNVHVQNTLQFAYELQKANKPFRMMLYPKSRHGVVNPLQVLHLRSMMLSFIDETLGTKAPKEKTEPAKTP